jgi:hypothetical protein
LDMAVAALPRSVVVLLPPVGTLRSVTT